MSDKVKVVTVKRPGWGQYVAEAEGFDISTEIEGMEESDGQIILEVGYMTREEIDNLPEFGGW